MDRAMSMFHDALGVAPLLAQTDEKIGNLLQRQPLRQVETAGLHIETVRQLT